MTRLRSCAATAWQARKRFVTARQARKRFATARQARKHFVTARQALTTAAIVLIAGGASVLACPVCFGAEETSMVDGTRLGVWVLLAITVTVQGAFVGFFICLRRRAKRFADVELESEWSELQRVSR